MFNFFKRFKVLIKQWLKGFIKQSPLASNLFRRYRTYRGVKGAGREIAIMLNAQCGGLAGKRVMELGSGSHGTIIEHIAKDYDVSEAVGINLVLEGVYQVSSKLRLQHGDIRKMEFPDNYFDILISSAVFEHLHNMDVALKEMYRVLKPGGFVFLQFGPIWSGSYGHHLWLFGKYGTYTYRNTLLPPYCHLLMSEEDVLDLLRQRGHIEADEIVHYVFHSKEQNQLMFSDYEQYFGESEFEVLYIKGYDFPLLQNMYDCKMTADTIRQLNKIFPENRDKFIYDGISAMLFKSL